LHAVVAVELKHRSDGSPAPIYRLAVSFGYQSVEVSVGLGLDLFFDSQRGKQRQALLGAYGFTKRKTKAGIARSLRIHKEENKGRRC
jgi:hypothetical protein